MSAWKRTSKKHPCPVCGHDSWCTYTADGAVMCQRIIGGGASGWRVINPQAGSPRMGTIYRRNGDPIPDSVRLSPAEAELKRKEDDAAAKREVMRAQEWWKRGVNDGPDAIRYVESRGVRMADLPGGKLPLAIRCTGDREDKVNLAEEPNEWVKTSGPVLVAAAVGPAGNIRAVQRIFLEPGGNGKRKPTPEQEAKGGINTKLGKGPLSGCAVRLQRGYPRGVLVLTEGIETGLAVLAATKLTTWACVSTSGLKLLELPEDDVGGGMIATIVIAGDHDRVTPELGYRPGAEAARIAAQKLRTHHRGIRVIVAIPTAEAFPGLFNEAGDAAAGKSVDWLDVYNRYGAAAVRDAIEAACASGVAPVEPPAPTEDPEGADESKFITANLLERARIALEELYAPPERTPTRGWTLRRWDGQWWRHDGIKYCPLSEESQRAHLRPWLNRFWTRKRGNPCRLNPPEKAVVELAASLQTDTIVESEAMPAWIGEDFGAEGAPRYGRRPWERVLLGGAARRSGLPSPEQVIVFENGIFDIDAWIGGRPRLMPHTERLFTATALPFACPMRELEETAGDDDAIQALIEKLCPTWLEFLDVVSGQDPEWEDLLAQWFGYCLTAWTRFEVVLVLSGATRAGKGTILNGLTSLLGKDNVASSDINLLTDKFHLHGLIGKTLCVMPDADVGRNTDAVRAAETLKKISGGDPVYVDRKHKDALAAVRLFCKIMIMCNRMPSLPDPSGAIASRFRVLQFEESFAGKEELRFKDQTIMEAESAGRMIWALRGLRILATKEKFVQPKKGAQLLDEYRDYSDPLRAFRDDCLKRNDARFTRSDELYEVWKRWCRAEGREERSHSWFCMQLRTACPWIDRDQRLVDGIRKWGYVGLEISNALDADRVTAWGAIPLPPT